MNHQVLIGISYNDYYKNIAKFTYNGLIDTFNTYRHLYWDGDINQPFLERNISIISINVLLNCNVKYTYCSYHIENIINIILKAE